MKEGIRLGAQGSDRVLFAARDLTPVVMDAISGTIRSRRKMLIILGGAAAISSGFYKHPEVAMVIGGAMFGIGLSLSIGITLTSRGRPSD